MIDHLIELRKKDTSIAVAWVYCDSKETKAQRAASLLRSLLRQLIQLRAELSESSGDLYKNYTDGHGYPQVNEVFRHLQSEIERFSRVYVVIDGLEECREDRNKIRDELLLPLRSRVNLMITARRIRYREFTNGQLETREHELKRHHRDVDTYATARVERGISGFDELNEVIREDTDLSERLRNRLITAADGLYVPLQCT